jgi:hypothetical protein
MECVEMCNAGFCWDVTSQSCYRCDDPPNDDGPPDDEPPEDDDPPQDEPPEDEDRPDDEPPLPPDLDDLATNEQLDATGDYIADNIWNMGDQITNQIDRSADFTVSALDVFADQITRQMDKSADRIVDSAESNNTDVLNQLESIEDQLADAGQEITDKLEELKEQEDDSDDAFTAPGGELAEIPQHRTIEDSFAAFQTRISASPIGQAFESLTFSEASGSCPLPDMDAGMFGVFSLQRVCTLYDSELAPFISAAAWVFWSVLSVRVFMQG